MDSDDAPIDKKRFETLFLSRIPLGKSENHLQSILDFHFPGSLFSASKRKPSKSTKKTLFGTGTMVAPIATIQENALLQQALSSPNGTPIDVPPLGKIYFKLKAARQNPQIEIATLKADMQTLKTKNEALQTELSEQKKRLKTMEEAFDAKLNKIFETQEANLAIYDNKMEEMINSFIHKFSFLLPGNQSHCQVPAKRGPLPSPPRHHKDFFNPS